MEVTLSQEADFRWIPAAAEEVWWLQVEYLMSVFRRVCDGGAPV